MSIEKHKGKITLACDECGQELKDFKDVIALYESEDFTIMTIDAKDNGWKLFKLDGKWQHTCGDCS